MKEELGLDHFEGRSWLGLHHHVVLTVIGYGFLQHLRLKQVTADARSSSADGASAERGENRARFILDSVPPIGLPSGYGRRTPLCQCWSTTSIPRMDVTCTP